MRVMAVITMLNLGLRYDSILCLGSAGILHLPPVVLSPWMKGKFVDYVAEICTN